MLEPDSLGLYLADLGADVIKVEAPGGDYVRGIGWPIVEGVSLMHLHLNRGKRSIELDLRTPGGVAIFRELVVKSDVVIEGMRPGSLAKRGLGYDELVRLNPAIIFCALSGFGGTGPYRDMPSHGVGFDAWAGLVPPVTDDRGFSSIPNHVSVGTRVGGVWAALGICAALVRARATGVGANLDVAQTDAAAATDWLRIEAYRAYERPESEVTGNPSDGGVRRVPGPGGNIGAVRYQYYATSNGTILFMASERRFWENFCRGAGRYELFEANPGAPYADHALGNIPLRRELTNLFASRTTSEWVQFGLDHDCPIVPVNDSRSLPEDPQFRARMPWLPRSTYGADLVPLPLHFVNEPSTVTRPAPTPGQQRDEVLTGVLGYSLDAISALEHSGAFGPPKEESD